MALPILFFTLFFSLQGKEGTVNSLTRKKYLYILNKIEKIGDYENNVLQLPNS